MSSPNSLLERQGQGTPIVAVLKQHQPTMPQTNIMSIPPSAFREALLDSASTVNPLFRKISEGSTSQIVDRRQQQRQPQTDSNSNDNDLHIAMNGRIERYEATIRSLKIELEFYKSKEKQSQKTSMELIDLIDYQSRANEVFRKAQKSSCSIKEQPENEAVAASGEQDPNDPTHKTTEHEKHEAHVRTLLLALNRAEDTIRDQKKKEQALEAELKDLRTYFYLQQRQSSKVRSTSEESELFSKLLQRQQHQKELGKQSTPPILRHNSSPPSSSASETNRQVDLDVRRQLAQIQQRQRTKGTANPILQRHHSGSSVLDQQRKHTPPPILRHHSGSSVFGDGDVRRRLAHLQRTKQRSSLVSDEDVRRKLAQLQRNRHREQMAQPISRHNSGPSLSNEEVLRRIAEQQEQEQQQKRNETIPTLIRRDSGSTVARPNAPPPIKRHNSGSAMSDAGVLRRIARHQEQTRHEAATIPTVKRHNSASEVMSDAQKKSAQGQNPKQTLPPVARHHSESSVSDPNVRQNVRDRQYDHFVKTNTIPLVLKKLKHLPSKLTAKDPKPVPPSPPTISLDRIPLVLKNLKHPTAKTSSTDVSTSNEGKRKLTTAEHERSKSVKIRRLSSQLMPPPRSPNIANSKQHQPPQQQSDMSFNDLFAKIFSKSDAEKGDGGRGDTAGPNFAALRKGHAARDGVNKGSATPDRAISGNRSNDDSNGGATRAGAPEEASNTKNTSNNRTTTATFRGKSASMDSDDDDQTIVF